MQSSEHELKPLYHSFISFGTHFMWKYNETKVQGYKVQGKVKSLDDTRWCDVCDN